MGFNLDTLQDEPDIVKQKDEEGFEKLKKLSPFDFMESITNGRTNIMISDHDEKSYVPFVVNRGLAMGADTLFFAHEMNKRYNLPNDLQYHYLRLSIKKGKRYNKWAKELKVDDINTITEYYGVNNQVALTYLNILTKEQIKEIKSRLLRSEGKIA